MLSFQNISLDPNRDIHPDKLVFLEWSTPEPRHKWSMSHISDNKYWIMIIFVHHKWQQCKQK